MTECKYAIVLFTEESEVETVPSSWLVDDSEMKWPNTRSQSEIKKLIRECNLPKENWNTVIPIRILGFSRSFTSANKKTSLFRNALDVRTDSSESEHENIDGPKKRVRPHRSDSSTEDDVDVPNNCVQNKKPKILNVHSLREDLSSTSTMTDQTQESFPVSPISPPNCPRLGPPTPHAALPAPQQDDKMVTMLAQIYKCLENIQNEVKSIKEEQVKMRYMLADLLNKNDPIKAVFVPPEGIFLPAETDNQLLEMNFRLSEDTNLITDLAHYLWACSSGKNISSFLHSVCRRVLHKSVAVLYSRVGHKGKKSFESLKEVYNAILAAAQLKFPDTPREEIMEKFGRVLATASEWDGGSRVNKSQF